MLYRFADGAAKEFQIETRQLYTRPWIYWRELPENPKNDKGDKKGPQGEDEENGVVKDKGIELDKIKF